MTTWNPRANELFLKALELGSAAERQQYLNDAWAGDAALRAEVEALLEASARAGSFLESPAAGLPSPLGGEGSGVRGIATVDEQPVSEGPGTVIGPYKLLEPIGEGGFGVVFLAEQQHPVRRKVALKVLKPGMDTRQVVARFEVERQALAIMDHPNIAKVHDGGATDSGRPSFVMELVKGVPITQFCDQNHLTPRQRLELFVPVCQAVQHAHQKGIIHRDLKPSNVLVSRHDTTPVVKVIDFGVAKALGQELTDKTLFTGIAQMIGTPLYMSPEQAGMSDLDIDTRSDIYSLGVLLYELLTGTTPFTKERFKMAAYDEIRRIIREEDPPKPSTRLSASKETLPAVAAQRQTEPAKLTRLVRGELDWIVMKALEKDRNRRYETATGLAADVQRYLADEPVLACPPSAGYRLRKFARRNKVGLMTAALVAAALVLGTGLSAWQAVRATEAEGQVKRQSEENERALRDKLGAEKQRADEQTKRAEAMEREKQALEKWRQTAYYLKIALAHTEYQANRVGRAEQLLAECPEDLRHWEWHYLKRLCRSELASIPPPGDSNRSYGTFSLDARRVARIEFTATSPDVFPPRHYDAIRVYDAETGKEVLQLPKEALERQSAYHQWAFSKDLKLFAALPRLGGKDKDPVIRVWEVATGKELPALPWSRAPMGKGMIGFSTPAFSPKGDRFAAIDPDDNLCIWEIATGKLLLRDPEVARLRAAMVAFSPDGRQIATTSSKGVTIWDAETGKLVRTLDGGGGSNVVVFSPKGSWVAATDRIVFRGDNSVRVWDTKTGQMGHVISRTRSAVSLAFSPDEQRLAMDSGEGTVTLWDLRTNRPLATYRGHDAGPIQALAFSPDGKQLRSLGFEGYVKTWETTRTPERRAFEEIRGVSRRLGALSPDGGLVAMVGSGVYVRDANTGKELWKFIPERGQGPAFYMAAFSPDGRYLAAGSSAGRFPDGNGPVWVWEAKTGKLVWNLPELEQRAELATFAVAFSPDGKRLASGGEGGAVHLWDVATGKELRKLPGHSMSVTSLEFSRDGRRLLAASGSLPTRATRDFGFGRSRKPDDPEDVPDLKVWDLGTGKEVLTLGLKGLLIAALSPDGTTVAVVCDRTARLYDVATSKETLVLKGVTAIGSEDHNLRGGGRSRTSPSAPTASGLSPPVLTVGDASVGASLSSCGTRRPGKRS